jgi:hypothetical protein
MKQPSNPILFFSLLLALIFQSLGFMLAFHRPLGGDEFNTQRSTLAVESYTDILLGKDKTEGNTSPLFYVLQKIWCDVFHFQTPQAWLDGNWAYVDPYANLLLRVLPIFWMSSFFLLLFVYFSSRFNIFFGYFSLLGALTSPVLWLYWTNARPYGLWVLLTAIQMILFLEILRSKKNVDRKWIGLSCVHVLLSLTCVLSFFQILLVSLMLLFKERRWQRYILPLALPMLFIYLYRPHSSGGLIFVLTPLQLILTAIPLNQMCILLFYPVMLRVFSLQNQKLLPKVFLHDEVKTVFPFFLSLFLMVASMFLLLKIGQPHSSAQGQYVVPRHVIFLIPVGVIGATYTAGLLWEGLKSYAWLRVMLMMIICWLLLFYIGFAWQKIYFFYTGDLTLLA